LGFRLVLILFVEAEMIVGNLQANFGSFGLSLFTEKADD
jgi:hypothetical protein